MPNGVRHSLDAVLDVFDECVATFHDTFWGLQLDRVGTQGQHRGDIVIISCLLECYNLI